MSRTPRRPKAVTIHPHPDHRPNDVMPPVAVDYDGFTFLVRFRIEEDRLEVWSIEVNRIAERGRKPRRITGTALRFPWAEIIDVARSNLALRLFTKAGKAIDEDDADEIYGPIRAWARQHGIANPVETTDAEATEIRRARAALALVQESSRDRTSRRGRPTEHDPARVAALYRDGLLITGQPTKYVAQKLNVSSASAAKLVARARQKGALEPAPGRGKAGTAPSTSKRKETR